MRRTEARRAGRGFSASRRGFSFLEIMLVVMIIGIMASIVGPLLAGRAREARVKATQNQIAAIETALGIYEMHTGDYPSSDEGLEALVERPSDVPERVWRRCLKEVPTDSWGRPFIYRRLDHDGGDYELVSTGRDGEAGTEDDVRTGGREASQST